MNLDPSVYLRFNRWLQRNRGGLVTAEQFRSACKLDEPDCGWQRAMSSLMTSARRNRRITSSRIVRDKYGSFKVLWKVVA